jgi:flagellar basal-body rod modification protein FlgD
MAATSIQPATQSSVTAAITNSGSAASAAAAVTDKTTIANNFQAFLLLLTTQLKNQNPLDPLDTNQFTQQLVQFAQVEQQLKSNQQLEALVAMQKTAQQTQALGYIGTTVAVDGSNATLANGSANWTFSVPKPASATITITNATGQTVYSGNYTLQAGQQGFNWDGRGNNGTQWPDGAYKLTVTASDASGQAVAVATEVEGVVDSVDLSRTPPVLSIGGQDFTMDKIKRVTRAAG